MKHRKEAKGLSATFAAVITILAASSCSLAEREENNAYLQLSIRQENTFATKAGGQPKPDTNQFILQIKNVSGEYVYNGVYSSRPKTISVPAGAYELSLMSEQMGAPAWDSPIYGDHVSIVASAGEKVSVDFLCKMVNSGVRIKMTGRYLERYPGELTIARDEGSLGYTSSETRFGYFSAGNATFSAVAADGSRQQLFSKQLSEGQLLTLTLDASSDASNAGISVILDTTATYLSQTIMVDRFQETSGDGASKASAFSIAQAAQHPEESVWVWGYIVGGDLTSSAVNFEAPFTKNSNLAIAPSAACKTRDECMSIELASGSDIREAVNLVDHPDMLGRKIYIQGTVKSSYFGLVGLKSIKEFILE